MRAYIDTSAAAKLLIDEAESDQLVVFCEPDDVELVATDLLETELRRVAHRLRVPMAAVTAVLDAITLHSLPRSAYVEAGLLPGVALRSLDALHVTGALRLEVDVALIYDGRMRQAAVDSGLRVLAPGDPSWAA